MKRLLSLFVLLIAVQGAAYAQGEIRISRKPTVPAACDPAGRTGPAIVWKTATTSDTCGTSKGLCTCTAADTWTYSTNISNTGIVAKTMAYFNAGSALTSTAAPTNGQVLIGSTGAIPALGTLTGTANETLITNGAASITIGLAASVQHKAGANWLFTDTTDTAKKFQFIASGITTANTRSITVPDSDTTLPIMSQALTFSGPTAARTITLPDSNTTVPIASQQLTFSGPTAARTITLPDSNTTVPIASQQLTFSGPTAARTITLPDANTTVPIASQQLTFSGPTAARTITVPDANFSVARTNEFNAHTNVAAPATPAAGITNTWTDATDKNLKAIDDAGVVTVTVKPDAGASNQFLTAVSTAGVISKAQPAFSDLSGSIASSQRGYGVYVALLSQTGTDAPVVTELENTVGAIVWARSAQGTYTATLTGAFTANKTIVFIGNQGAGTGAVMVDIQVTKTSANVTTLVTYSLDAGASSHDVADALLVSTEIEIRVYP